MNNPGFSILIEPDAFLDIQSAIDYYEEAQIGLGKKFEDTFNQLFLKLEKAPFFAVRYLNVHCVPVRKFPFMVHYTTDENQRKII